MMTARVGEREGGAKGNWKDLLAGSTYNVWTMDVLCEQRTMSPSYWLQKKRCSTVSRTKRLEGLIISDYIFPFCVLIDVWVYFKRNAILSKSCLSRIPTYLCEEKVLKGSWSNIKEKYSKSGIDKIFPRFFNGKNLQYLMNVDQNHHMELPAKIRKNMLENCVNWYYIYIIID